MSVIVLGTILTVAVLARFEISPILLTLTLSYSLTVNDRMMTVVFCQLIIESNMVNVQRCLSLLRIPQENLEGDMIVEEFQATHPDWPT